MARQSGKLGTHHLFQAELAELEGMHCIVHHTEYFAKLYPGRSIFTLILVTVVTSQVVRPSQTGQGGLSWKRYIKKYTNV